MVQKINGFHCSDNVKTTLNFEVEEVELVSESMNLPSGDLVENDSNNFQCLITIVVSGVEWRRRREDVENYGYCFLQDLMR